MATQVRSRQYAEREVQERRRVPVWFALMLGGGVLGAVAAGWSLVERIAYAESPSSASFCEINSVISCNSIFGHWQSSALGVPNTLVSLPVFALLASAGLAGVLGSRLSRGYLATLFGLTVFMTGFVTWYMHQSAFAIGALCLFCTVGAAALITIGIAVTRVVDAEQALGTGRAGRQLRLL
ncbi:MAG TPA: vitamin K epoxide reductase family protein, partial [Nocardioidaceae bacterium]|nr:vitamin K epoxide reductase family protein [Nocardioidaceae bacterium]